MRSPLRECYFISFLKSNAQAKRIFAVRHAVRQSGGVRSLGHPILCRLCPQTALAQEQLTGAAQSAGSGGIAGLTELCR